MQTGKVYDSVNIVIIDDHRSTVASAPKYGDIAEPTFIH